MSMPLINNTWKIIAGRMHTHTFSTSTIVAADRRMSSLEIQHLKRKGLLLNSIFLLTWFEILVIRKENCYDNSLRLPNCKHDARLNTFFC